MNGNLSSEQDLHRAFLCIGGNVGNRELYLDKTVKLVAEKVGSIIQLSSVFESEAWGFTHSVSFLNQVVEVETTLSALCLLSACQLVEDMLGRQRPKNTDGYSARTADVDILFYDDCIYTFPQLIVPHPRLHERLFVLEPLTEIAPDFMHPKIGKTIGELKNLCVDSGAVWNYKQVRGGVVL